METTGLQSYVDYTVELGWGFLYKYSVYIGNYTLAVRPIPSVRLQIWIPKAEGFTDPEYQLKWETILTVEEDDLNKLHEVSLYFNFLKVTCHYTLHFLYIVVPRSCYNILNQVLCHHFIPVFS